MKNADVRGIIRGAVVLVGLLAVAEAFAQTPGAPRAASILVTVLDPLGDPAADVPLLLENDAFQTPFIAQGRTDRKGQYRVRVPPGRYVLTAPIDFFPGARIAVPAGQLVEQTVRMELDTTTGSFTVCIDCLESEAAPPTSIVEEFRTDREAASNSLASGAEPEGGWEFFRPDAPEALRRLGAGAPVGTVVIEGHVGSDGRARDLRPVSSAHPALAAAAVATLQDTRWRPARVRGRAVDVPLHITFEYSRQHRP